MIPSRPSVSTMRSESAVTLRSCAAAMMRDVTLAARTLAGKEDTPRSRKSRTPSISTGAVAMSASDAGRPPSWACSQAGPKSVATSIRASRATRVERAALAQSR